MSATLKAPLPSASNNLEVPPDKKLGVSEIRKIQDGSVENIRPNIIEQVDRNYVEETSKIDLGNIASIDATDHLAMRKWLKDVYMALPKVPQIKRIRPPVPVHVQEIPIIYAHEEKFSVRIYNPSVEDGLGRTLRPALLMIHGGGWIHGSPEVDEELSQYFASELRCVVIGVDYRLAPECPFPKPGDDCYEALNWTLKNSGEFMIDTKRIGVWGCSSGGNLAASIALRDSAEHETSRIRHVNLVVPATCHPSLYPEALRSNDASMQKFPFGGISEEAAAGLRKLWSEYAGSHFSNPYASVLLAEPRNTHPPVHITVAGCDGLRDEGIAYALRLRNAGVDTQLEIIPGLPHGINVSPVGFAVGQFFRNQVRALDYALNSSL